MHEGDWCNAGIFSRPAGPLLWVAAPVFTAERGPWLNTRRHRLGGHRNICMTPPSAMADGHSTVLEFREESGLATQRLVGPRPMPIRQLGGERAKGRKACAGLSLSLSLFSLSHFGFTT